jgi:hypothetical protein
MSIPSPDIVARVRHRYAEGAPVADILKDSEMSRQVFLRCLAGDCPGPDGEQPEPIVLRSHRSGEFARKRTTRRALTRRLWRAAERQVCEVEERFALAEREPGERERDARILAVLVRTLRELSDFDAEETRQKAEAAADNDDAIPRNLDELRRELSRRMDRMAAATAPRISGEPEE